MSAQSFAMTNQVAERERSILRNVYLWMTAGLAITGFVAWYIAGNEELLIRLFSNMALLIGIIIAQLALVFIMSAFIMKMSIPVAAACFTGYSVLMGITMSVIFLVYTESSIAKTFFITAGTFAGMSLWAVTTKKDLSGWGSYLFMALIGLIIASVVNMFLKSSAIDWVITFAGVAIFVGLTAYDTQTIKKWNEEAGVTSDDQLFTRLSIMGALKLYLDFINLFLYLLKIFGKRR
jgi:FtsH-binding integral membrane protein